MAAAVLQRVTDVVASQVGPDSIYSSKKGNDSCVSKSTILKEKESSESSFHLGVSSSEIQQDTLKQGSELNLCLSPDTLETTQEPSKSEVETFSLRLSAETALQEESEHESNFHLCLSSGDTLSQDKLVSPVKLNEGHQKAVHNETFSESLQNSAIQSNELLTSSFKTGESEKESLTEENQLVKSTVEDCAYSTKGLGSAAEQPLSSVSPEKETMFGSLLKDGIIDSESDSSDEEEISSKGMRSDLNEMKFKIALPGENSNGRKFDSDHDSNHGSSARDEDSSIDSSDVTLQKEKPPARKSAARAREEMQQIRSDSQRFVRESRLSLPYHKPKQMTLKEFLKQRRSNPQTTTIINEACKGSEGIEEPADISNESLMKQDLPEGGPIVSFDEVVEKLNTDSDYLKTPADEMDLPSMENVFKAEEQTESKNHETEVSVEQRENNELLEAETVSGLCNQTSTPPHVSSPLSELSALTFSRRRRAKLLTLEAVKELTPQLSKDPLIELEEPSSKGLSNLMERFVKHSLSGKTKSNKKEIYKKEESVAAPSLKVPLSLTPGEKIALLKKQLLSKMAERRRKERELRIQAYKLENEEIFENGELEEDMFSGPSDVESTPEGSEDEEEGNAEEAEDEEEEDEEEDDTDEDDIIISRKKRKNRNPFIDDEAVDDDDGDDYDRDNDFPDTEAQLDEAEVRSIRRADTLPLKLEESVKRDVFQANHDKATAACDQDDFCLALDDDEEDIDNNDELNVDAHAVRIESTPSLNFTTTPHSVSACKSFTSDESDFFTPISGLTNIRKKTSYAKQHSVDTVASDISDKDSTPLHHNVSDVQLPFSPMEEVKSMTRNESMCRNSSRGPVPRNLTDDFEKGLKAGSDADITGTQNNMDELLGLCSGQFARKKNVEASQGTQNNMDELIGLCSGQFTGRAAKETENKFTNSKGIQKRTKDDDEDSFIDDKIQSTEDEEEDEEQEQQQKEKIEDSNGDSSDEEDFFILPKKRERLMKEFFEDEAELSGSDVGSDADEDIPEDEDVLEEDLLADGEKMNQDQLREQVGRIHMKQLMDEDKREIKIYQELLLEDGDLHSEGAGRQRKFRWQNTDAGFEADDNKLESEEEDDKNEEDANWRIQRHEREKWLKEQEGQKDGSPVKVSLGKSKLAPIFVKQKEFLHEKEPQSKSKLRSSMCGSFLKLGDNVLQRIANRMKTTGVSEKEGSLTTKNFVFRAVNEKEAKKKLSQEAQDAPSAKKIKVELSQNSFLEKSVFDFL